MKVLDLLLTLALYQPTTISCVCLYIIDISLNIYALLVCTQHIMECTCTYMYIFMYISGGPRKCTTFNRAFFRNRLVEFHKKSRNIFSTCPQSHWEFSKQTDYNCRNDRCVKIVCPKTQYIRCQQYGMCMACTPHGILLWSRTVKLVFGAKFNKRGLLKRS